MQDLQLVIFDCDGVLVDSETISNGVLARLLSAEGLPTTLAQARRDYQGLLLGEVFEQAERKLGRALPEDLPSRFESERAEVFRRELEPVPGVAEAVEQVAAAGVAACVASQGKLEKRDAPLRAQPGRPLRQESSCHRF
jgi:beta-phosphoglucomutase-like phosphatase (HAD superfamily)